MTRSSLRITAIAAGALASFAAASAQAGSIVQEGSLSGVKGTNVHEVILDQFDTQGGTLELKFVQLDFLTSVIGGYTTDGSGTPVDILASLFAEWATMDAEILATTHALVDTTVPNTSVISATVFDTDTASGTIIDAGDLSDWIGAGTISLQAFTNFQVSEDPAGIIGFGAGGTVRYTVTYEYNIVPAPGAGLLLALGMVGARRRRGA